MTDEQMLGYGNFTGYQNSTSSSTSQSVHFVLPNSFQRRVFQNSMRIWKNTKIDCQNRDTVETSATVSTYFLLVI